MRRIAQDHDRVAVDVLEEEADADLGEESIKKFVIGLGVLDLVLAGSVALRVQSDVDRDLPLREQIERDLKLALVL